MELSCALCCQLLTEPLLLPCCCRAVCSSCAKAPPLQDSSEDVASDKASEYSETDSGVVVGAAGSSVISRGNSQQPPCGLPIPPPIIPPPPSYAEDPIPPPDGAKCPVPGCLGDVPTGGDTQTVQCPSCQKPLSLGPGGLGSLPPYPAMARILARHKGEVSTTGGPYPPCQLCEGAPGDATVSCVECKIQYCNPCLTSCHPLRGPLSTHSLVPVSPLANLNVVQSVAVCGPHAEVGNVYCTVCGCVVCTLCKEQLHPQHDIQPLDHLAKTSKVSTPKLSCFSSRKNQEFSWVLFCISCNPLI